MKRLLTFVLLSCGLISAAKAVPNNIPIPRDGVVDIWSRIPFIRGADLCRYRDAYSQTRTQFMNQMVSHAQRLMSSGARGSEALQMLYAFNEMYDRNLEYATVGLETTLSSTMMAYLDSYYRTYNPQEKRISFARYEDWTQYDGNIVLRKLDYIAYGTYALAPNCQGDITVTFHMIGKDNRLESFTANGRPDFVMSQVASQLFTLIQRTQFPSRIQNYDGSTLTLIGAANGSVGIANSVQQAERACRAKGARLPNADELEMSDSYGDWSGGVSIGKVVWAINGGMIYAPLLRNPTPVRRPSEVNDREFRYYCVK